MQYKVYQHGSVNFRLISIPLALVHTPLLAPLWGAWGIYALNTVDIDIVPVSLGCLRDLARIGAGGAALTLALFVAKHVDALQTGKRQRSFLQEAASCAFGVGVCTVGELLSASLAQVAIPTLAAATCVGGGAYFALRTFKWLKEKLY